MFASFIPAIADILGQRQRYGGFYESTVGIRSENYHFASYIIRSTYHTVLTIAKFLIAVRIDAAYCYRCLTWRGLSAASWAHR